MTPDFTKPWSAYTGVTSEEKEAWDKINRQASSACRLKMQRHYAEREAAIKTTFMQHVGHALTNEEILADGQVIEAIRFGRTVAFKCFWKGKEIPSPAFDKILVRMNAEHEQMAALIGSLRKLY